MFSMVFMWISKEVSAIIADLDASFHEFVGHDGIFVVELDRALYRCIESALLWYKELSGFVAKTGFIPNLW